MCPAPPPEESLAGSGGLLPVKEERQSGSPRAAVHEDPLWMGAWEGVEGSPERLSDAREFAGFVRGVEPRAEEQAASLMSAATRPRSRGRNCSVLGFPCRTLNRRGARHRRPRRQARTAQQAGAGRERLTASIHGHSSRPSPHPQVRGSARAGADVDAYGPKTCSFQYFATLPANVQVGSSCPMDGLPDSWQG